MWSRCFGRATITAAHVRSSRVVAIPSSPGTTTPDYFSSWHASRYPRFVSTTVVTDESEHPEDPSSSSSLSSLKLHMSEYQRLVLFREMKTSFRNHEQQQWLLAASSGEVDNHNDTLVVAWKQLDARIRLAFHERDYHKVTSIWFQSQTTHATGSLRRASESESPTTTSTTTTGRTLSLSGYTCVILSMMKLKYYMCMMDVYQELRMEDMMPLKTYRDQTDLANIHSSIVTGLSKLPPAQASRLMISFYHQLQQQSGGSSSSPRMSIGQRGLHLLIRACVKEQDVKTCVDILNFVLREGIQLNEQALVHAREFLHDRPEAVRVDWNQLNFSSGLGLYQNDEKSSSANTKTKVNDESTNSWTSSNFPSNLIVDSAAVTSRGGPADDDGYQQNEDTRRIQRLMQKQDFSTAWALYRQTFLHPSSPQPPLSVKRYVLFSRLCRHQRQWKEILCLHTRALESFPQDISPAMHSSLFHSFNELGLPSKTLQAFDFFYAMEKPLSSKTRTMKKKLLNVDCVQKAIYACQMMDNYTKCRNLYVDILSAEYFDQISTATFCTLIHFAIAQRDSRQALTWYRDMTQRRGLRSQHYLDASLSSLCAEELSHRCRRVSSSSKDNFASEGEVVTYILEHIPAILWKRILHQWLRSSQWTLALHMHSAMTKVLLLSLKNSPDHHHSHSSSASTTTTRSMEELESCSKYLIRSCVVEGRDWSEIVRIVGRVDQLQFHLPYATCQDLAQRALRESPSSSSAKNSNSNSWTRFCLDHQDILHLEPFVLEALSHEYGDDVIELLHTQTKVSLDDIHTRVWNRWMKILEPTLVPSWSRLVDYHKTSRSRHARLDMSNWHHSWTHFPFRSVFFGSDDDDDDAQQSSDARSSSRMKALRSWTETYLEQHEWHDAGFHEHIETFVQDLARLKEEEEEI